MHSFGKASKVSFESIQMFAEEKKSSSEIALYFADLTTLPVLAELGMSHLSLDF